MNNIMSSLGHKLGPVTVILVLSGLTLGTSVMGASKVIGSFQIEKPKTVEIPQIKPTDTPDNVNSNNPSGCIITLFGKKYNVTTLKSSHPGGDIFKCGTDMTSIYQSQHGNDLSRMQSYFVIDSQSSGNPNNTTGKNTSNPSVKQESSNSNPGNSGGKLENENEDGKEDEKVEKREVDHDSESDNKNDD